MRAEITNLTPYSRDRAARRRARARSVGGCMHMRAAARMRVTRRRCVAVCVCAHVRRCAERASGGMVPRALSFPGTAGPVSRPVTRVCVCFLTSYSLLSPTSLPPAAGPCGRMPSRVVYVRFGLRRSCDGVCAVGVRAGAVGSLLRPSPLSPKSSTAVQRSDRGTGSVRVATRRRGRAEGERPPLRASGAALHEEGGVDSAFKRAWRHSLAD